MVSFRYEPDDLVVVIYRKYDRVNAVEMYFYTRNQNEAAPPVDLAHFSEVIGERRGAKVLEVLGHDAKGQSLIAQDRCDLPECAPAVMRVHGMKMKSAVDPSCHREFPGTSAGGAVHDEAARPEDTDWPQILALYNLLRRISDNPMVTLNHAIAAAMVHGATKGLELLDALKADARLSDNHRLDAVRAHLLELAGNREDAVRHYRAAAGKTGSLPERNYLLTQAARLSSELGLMGEGE